MFVHLPFSLRLVVVEIAPAIQKRKERHKTLYRGLWGSLLAEIKAQAKLPQKVAHSRWAAALYRILPKEGDNINIIPF